MLPEAFVDSLRALLPAGDHEAIVAAMGGAPTVSVRVNKARGVDVPGGARRVPWWLGGFYCDRRPAFTFDPLWHAGAYYAQDASSMFIAHVVKSLVTRPVCWLDLCAAPGGKTTATLDALPDGSLMVANDAVSARARVLCDNVNRWGRAATMVTNDLPERWGRVGPLFDVIAADVPCSGEGMMRKDAEAAAQWSPELVAQCARRQRAIVDEVWPALKPGGLLIYSTCTFNRDENEEVVNHLVDRHGAVPLTVPVDPSWGIAPGIGVSFPCYRFMPHKLDGEGLFVAVLRKPDAPWAEVKLRRQPSAAACPARVRSWLSPDTDWRFIEDADRVFAMPARWHMVAAAVSRAVRTLQAGFPLAVKRGPKWQPDHALALSMSRCEGAFAAVEVDFRTALDFLRGNVLTLTVQPRGWILVCYRGFALGWVNNLGTRANNLYPRQLRVLSTHIPDRPQGPLDNVP